MPARDLAALCAELKAVGASPEAALSAARSQGLDRTDTIRLLRELFELTLAGARDVMGEAPAVGRHPPIDTREQLHAVLRNELGYCDCASAETRELLVTFLRAARKRSDEMGDAVDVAGPSGLAHWFVFALEQRGLVTHNFRISDVWITDKGRWLLEALERVR